MSYDDDYEFADEYEDRDDDEYDISLDDYEGMREEEEYGSDYCADPDDDSDDKCW